ncbi:MAG: C_GCAxxG_C_C family protein [Firmicutes bacterium]|nr:C_GCAxxG_C_C family protein [Bacillota bacterium]
MGKKEEAAERHSKGFNCTQAVVCSFCDELNISEQEAFKLAEGFGFGMGAKEVCGAVSGMLMVASYLSSDGNLDKPATKQKTYKVMRELQEEFFNKNTSIYCRELLGGPGQPKLRSCRGCVEDAAEILEAKFFAEK